MTDTTKSKCTHYPRCPYTHTGRSFDLCCIGCDKPGPGSMAHNPGDNRCSDCALCCLPCNMVQDILCCIPMIFGCYVVEEI